jgi:flagellar hook-associated protein 2
MASSIGIDGLISGMKTSDIIDQLIAVEGNQQKLLASKKTGLQSVVTAMQSLNTKVASLATASAAALKADSWKATTATASSTAVTATTTAEAQPSSVTLTVDKLAASQSTLYGLPTSYTDATPTFTLTSGGDTTTITALSTHIGDIVAAFNAEGTGVTASAVNVGTVDEPLYKLQLTGQDTGKDSKFTLVATNPNDGTGLIEQELRAASDAQVTLWPGTPGQTTVKSATNSFKGLLSGVDLTVSKAGTEEVTVTVARSSAAMSTLASNLVSNLNAVLGDISDRTKPTNGTAADGSAILTGGLFSGNTSIRLLQQSLLAAGSTSAPGTSAASVGMILNKDGTFTFDSAKFATAYAEDPDGVQKVVQSIAAKLEDAATTASDPKDGTLTSQVTDMQSEVKDLTDRIAGWDDRLAMRRATLVKTYTAMEVSMSKMQSTSNFLTQQLAQLNANNAS